MSNFYFRIKPKSLDTKSLKTNYFEFYAENYDQLFESEDLYIVITGKINNIKYDELSKESFVNFFQNENFYSRLEGHFSFVIVYKKEPVYRLVTNRLGGNRLYYTSVNDTLLTSNSIFTLKENIKQKITLNKSSLRQLMEYRWLTENESLLSGIYQTQPGEYIEFHKDKLPKLSKYWRFPIKKACNSSMSEHVERTTELLAKSMKEVIGKNDRIGLLLSGGVDSSLLGGILKDLGVEFIAYSHRNENHPNPELDTAVQFAKHLKVRHEIVDIKDDQVPGLFVETVKTLEQPPRSQSSIILYKLLEKMGASCNVVIYGECADTLFGSNVVKRLKNNLQKKKLIETLGNKIPFFQLLLKKVYTSEKVDSILNTSALTHNISEAQLELNSCSKKWIDINIDNSLSFSYVGDLLEKIDKSFDSSKIELNLFKAIVFRGDCANHFQETSSIASKCNIQVVSPFGHNDVIDYAATLNDKVYYGNDFVKPILRKIGERHYPKELLYLTKYGFPAPYEKWLSTCLHPLWEKACIKFSLSPNDNYDNEFRWNIISLSTLLEYLEVDF